MDFWVWIYINVCVCVREFVCFSANVDTRFGGVHSIHNFYYHYYHHLHLIIIIIWDSILLWRSCFIWFMSNLCYLFCLSFLPFYRSFVCMCIVYAFFFFFDRWPPNRGFFLAPFGRFASIFLWEGVCTIAFHCDEVL